MLKRSYLIVEIHKNIAPSMTSQNSIGYYLLLLLVSQLLWIRCGDGVPDDPFANVTSALNVDLLDGYSDLKLSTA